MDENPPIPPLSVVCAVFSDGTELTVQHTPRAVIAEFPSDVTVPPQTADVEVIWLTTESVTTVPSVGIMMFTDIGFSG